MPRCENFEKLVVVRTRQALALMSNQSKGLVASLGLDQQTKRQKILDSGVTVCRNLLLLNDFKSGRN